MPCRTRTTRRNWHWGLRRLPFQHRRILDLSDGITGTALAETGNVWEQACNFVVHGLGLLWREIFEGKKSEGGA